MMTCLHAGYVRMSLCVCLFILPHSYQNNPNNLAADVLNKSSINPPHQSTAYATIQQQTVQPLNSNTSLSCQPILIKYSMQAP